MNIEQVRKRIDNQMELQLMLIHKLEVEGNAGTPNYNTFIGRVEAYQYVLRVLKESATSAEELEVLG